MRNIFFTDESVKINWFNSEKYFFTDSISENLTDLDLESTCLCPEYIKFCLQNLRNGKEDKNGRIYFVKCNFLPKVVYLHRKKSIEFVTSNRRFWLKFSYLVYKLISLSFSNGLLYITSKKKPIFRLHLRLFLLCTTVFILSTISQILETNFYLFLAQTCRNLKSIKYKYPWSFVSIISWKIIFENVIMDNNNKLYIFLHDKLLSLITQKIKVYNSLD